MKQTILDVTKTYSNDIFLDGSMGLQEYTNPKYPIFSELAEMQLHQLWPFDEIKMENDSNQWTTLSKNDQQISVLNLTWQVMADSVAGRAPFTVLLDLVSNPELEEMIIEWGKFEQLHSKAYTNIIKTVFPNPQEIIDEIKVNAEAFKRLEKVIEVYDKLKELSCRRTLGLKVDDDEIRKQIYLTIVAMYGLESIMFYCSFACTFALSEQKILVGVAQTLQLIAKDEALHTRMSHAIITTLKSDPKYKAIIKESHDEAIGILNSIVGGECDWADYIFSEGRQIVGLNSTVLKEYLHYIANNAYKAINFKFPFDVPKYHAIPWIDKYLDPNKNKPAPQDVNATNYKMNAIDNDTDDLDIDF